mgnify:CR=1 FL=1
MPSRHRRTRLLPTSGVQRLCAKRFQAMSQFTFDTIGLIRSPYKEKFAIPRQPGLIEDGGGELELIAPYNQPEAVRGLEEFSHLWIVFVFHQTMEGGWRPTVRPPRLGGNARMGVFATRSTFRPNPIGMSLVELKSVETKGGKVILPRLGRRHADHRYQALPAFC